MAVAVAMRQPNIGLVCLDKSPSASRCKSGRGKRQSATSQAPSALGDQRC